MKRRLIKIISMILIIGMIATVGIFADNKNEEDVHDQINVSSTIMAEIDGLDFTISETKNEDLSVTREFHRENNADGDLTFDRIIALLSALGMSEKEIEALTEETLSEVSKTDMISVTVSYSKTNEITGETTYLSEDDALAQVDDVLAKKDVLKYENSSKKNAFVDISIYDSDSTRNTGISEDEIMRITVTALHVIGTSNQYRLATYATWLTTPPIRNKDGIGISATNCTIVAGSMSAYSSYRERIEVYGITSSTNTIYNSITGSNLIQVNSYGWTSALGLIQMPPYNSYGGSGPTGTDIIYDEFFAYISCYIELSSSASSYFSVVGSHSHCNSLFASVSGVGLDSAGAVQLYPTNTSQDKRKCTISVAI